jgi:hypothetical protein
VTLQNALNDGLGRVRKGHVEGSILTAPRLGDINAVGYAPVDVFALNRGDAPPPQAGEQRK